VKVRRKQKVPEEIRRFWALLDMPMDAAWHQLNTRRDGATDMTIEALMLSLRRGPEALARPDTLDRLAQLNERQLIEVITRLQKFKHEIATAWTREQLEILIAARRKL
jgi:hypothetical protein